MMRLLFLCLLLLLPASAADNSDLEGSADVPDDEELEVERAFTETSSENLDSNPGTGKNTGVDENRDEGYLIIIVIAGVVLALSVVAVVTILIVKRKMQQGEQGIYSVPVEQDHKGPV